MIAATDKIFHMVGLAQAPLEPLNYLKLTSHSSTKPLFYIGLYVMRMLVQADKAEPLLSVCQSLSV